LAVVDVYEATAVETVIMIGLGGNPIGPEDPSTRDFVSSIFSKNGKKARIKKEWGLTFLEVAAANSWDYPRLHEGSNFTDISAGGYSYVDLVLSGGGMLGIAHAGYIHALEESNLRFRAVAGTSAGALSALMLSTLRRPDQYKGIRLAVALAMLDGDKLLEYCRARLFFRLYFKRKYKYKCVKTLIKIVFFFPFLNRICARGMITGTAFQELLEDFLKDRCFPKESKKFLEYLNKDRRPNFTCFDPSRKTDDLNLELSVVVSDITRDKKIVLPDMEKEEEEAFEEKDRNIATYVRASASVLLFFVPVEMKLSQSGIDALGNAGKKEENERNKRQKYSVDLVDGGLMSNFPMSLFHRPSSETSLDNHGRPFTTPRLPSFGVKLNPIRNSFNKTKGVFKYLGALFRTAIDVADDEFIRLHPDFEQLVTTIDIEDDIEPFNVFMTRKEKIRLFKLGYRAGKEFLMRFNWLKHKEYRAAIHSHAG